MKIKNKILNLAFLFSASSNFMMNNQQIVKLFFDNLKEFNLINNKIDDLQELIIKNSFIINNNYKIINNNTFINSQNNYMNKPLIYYNMNLLEENKEFNLKINSLRNKAQMKIYENVQLFHKCITIYNNNLSNLN